MKKCLFFSIVLFFTFVIPAYTDLVSDTSSAFSFPMQVKSSFQDFQGRKSNLSYRQSPAFSGNLRIMWEVSGSLKKNSRIEIYTLSGRRLNTFNIDSNSGYVNWDCSKQILSSQMLVMRLKNGNYTKRIKMLLF